MHKVTPRENDEVLTILCDRRHIRQMMINMLTNAIKYTPDGGTIDLWAERIPGGKIKINVKDTGVGIEESDRSKVFSPFERVQNAYSINQAGTGLGMSLTKRLTEVNGGSIDFSSTPGKGSHFWLILPAVEFSPEARQSEPADMPKVRGKGELVLLVESDPGERSMLARYLSHTGFRVAAVGTNLEVLHILREQRVDLAILDNKMVDDPESGLLKDIRENAKSQHLPLVLLSSRAFVFDIEKYLTAGVDRCLTKPVGLKELGAICRSLLDSRSEEQSAAKPAEKERQTVQGPARLMKEPEVYH